MDQDDPMTTNVLGRGGAARRMRRGMTLVEVIIAIVILSGAMLGLADFVRRFQHNTSDTSMQALASNLATVRLEEIKGFRVYTNIAATYNGVVETFATDPVYKGFTRTTAAVACAGCPTLINDYVTITVTVTGNNLTAPMKKTTIIARF
jgi:prepilin-type N-terminal cleavage/methylation domain-containing protein